MQKITTILVSGLGLTLTTSGVGNLFIIDNPTTGMFVTQDQLRSLLGLDKVNVLYGPSKHVCFPWEKRLKLNNISLEEAPNEFEFEVQCKDGILKGKGSYRMRPDMQNPVAFLTGVAAVADEIRDLIVADIVSFFKNKKVIDAVNKLAGLNKNLLKFKVNHKNIEERFGVQITDVTVSKLLPSDEVSRSISALTEAWAVQRGTELLLGIPEGSLAEKTQAGDITQADVKEARDRFLSISGNLEGMDIKRYEFAVQGLNPEIVNTLAELAKSPAAQALATAGAKRSGGGKTSKPKNVGGNK